jgi:hypothetical protein
VIVTILNVVKDILHFRKKSVLLVFYSDEISSLPNLYSLSDGVGWVRVGEGVLGRLNSKLVLAFQSQTVIKLLRA